MPSIRDEFSKVVEVRVPPNGYRKYAKELSRTGKFGQLQQENTIIILLEAVDELQRQVEELGVPQPKPLPMQEMGELSCDTCGKICASAFGLQAHQRSHVRSTPTTK